MLCEICTSIFRGPQRLKEGHHHHQSLSDVKIAAEQGCYICRTIANDLSKDASHKEDLSLEWYLGPSLGLPNGWWKLTIDNLGPQNDTHSASDGYVSDDEGEEHVRDSGGDDEESFMEEEEIPEGKIWGWTIQPSQDVSHCIGDYHPPATFDSDELFNLALNWYHACKEGHRYCQRTRDTSFIPSRLLDLSGAGAAPRQQIKLLSTRDTSLDEPYATLSHCWGKANTLKLLSDNVNSLQEAIKVSMLPMSYREAIKVALHFGIRYLWIDSLCIMQDSKEDWLFEASRMGDVYAHSDLNIAAAGAAENSEPSFSERHPGFLLPAQVEAEWDGFPSQTYRITLEDLRRREIDESPLRERAWVLQEVWLAPRVLNFGKTQAWWECLELEACETYSHSIPRGWLENSENIERRADEQDRYIRYEGLAEMYSRSALTFDSDRVIAFTGIAKRFQQTLNDEYIAGMWRSQLPRQLLWQTTRHKFTHRPEKWRAPSWSWLSIEGDIEFGHKPRLGSEIQTLCELVDVKLKLVDLNNSCGLLKGGYIKLRAPLLEVKLHGDGLAVLREEDESFQVLGYPSEDLSNLGIDFRPVTYSFDESVSEDMGERFSCISVMQWEQEGHLWLLGLILYCAVDKDNEKAPYRREGYFQIVGAELVEQFKRATMCDIVIE